MATASVEENINDEVASNGDKKSNVNYPGPNPVVKYPLTVVYCGECGLPIELCEYSANPDACKDWLEKTHPNLLANLNNLSITNQTNDKKENETESEKRSTHQRRGGKGMPKPKKERQPSKVIISKQQRKGNKYVTIISGLAANGIDIDSAKKFLAQKFACSCSKGDGDELIIQGDVLDNLFDVIPEQYSEITEDMIEEKS